MIGEIIEHYRILQVVGRGGMGVVYKALDVNLDRTVAVKVLSAELQSDPSFVERFRHEARVQAALNHPNVATLFDFLIWRNSPVAVMEFIEGESLANMIQRCGPIPAQLSLPIIVQALRGVGAGHRRGIIHRDLKPANLMLNQESIVKVTDFGIAKVQNSTGMTQASTRIGSSYYMAPEQILGRAVDVRTDIYAMGITLYELLCGVPPFRAKVQFEIESAHVRDIPEPPTVHCPNIPQAAVDAVMRALAKDPDQRFSSADEFIRALPEVQGVPLEPALGSAAAEPIASLSSRRRAATAEPMQTVTLSTGIGSQGLPAITAAHPPPLQQTPDTARTVLHSRPSASAAPSAPTASAAAPPAAFAPAAPASRAAAVSSADHAAQALGAGSATASAANRSGKGLVIAASAALALVLSAGALIRYGGWLPRRGAAERSVQRPAGASGPAATPSPGVGTQPISPQGPVAAVGSPVAEPQPAPAAPVRAQAAVNRDLSGLWTGVYADAAGRARLQILGLELNQQADGKVTGTLRYQSDSGDDRPCVLAQSSYAVEQKRLRLIVSCPTPNHPKYFNVPLDFANVDPRSDALTGGHLIYLFNDITVSFRRANGA